MLFRQADVLDCNQPLAGNEFDDAINPHPTHA
jgi:hypothetical protein